MLCESRYAFPESRIRELLSLIEREITDEELLKFHRCMPEELRDLGNAWARNSFLRTDVLFRWYWSAVKIIVQSS